MTNCNKWNVTLHVCTCKGPSKNVNIFVSLQTVHFFRTPPPPPKVYRPTFCGSKTRVSRSTTFIVQQQKLTRLRSLLCDKWSLWLCIMIYRLQLMLYSSKFNLNMYLLCIQRKYVQFHNIKFKIAKSQLLIGLETSFSNWQKAQHVKMYFPSKVYIWCYPPYPLVYGLYTYENVDNYGWPLSSHNISCIFPDKTGQYVYSVIKHPHVRYIPC